MQDILKNIEIIYNRKNTILRLLAPKNDEYDIFIKILKEYVKQKKSDYRIPEKDKPDIYNSIIVQNNIPIFDIFLYIIINARNEPDLSLVKRACDNLYDYIGPIFTNYIKNSNKETYLELQNDMRSKIIQALNTYLPYIKKSKFYISPGIDKQSDKRKDGYYTILDIIVYIIKIGIAYRYDIQNFVKEIVKLVNKYFGDEIIIDKCTQPYSDISGKNYENEQCGRCIERSLYIVTNYKNKYACYKGNDDKIYISSAHGRIASEYCYDFDCNKCLDIRNIREWTNEGCDTCLGYKQLFNDAIPSTVFEEIKNEITKLKRPTFHDRPEYPPELTHYY